MTHPRSLKSRAERELALFLVTFLGGLVLLPVAVYLVGDAIFGTYAGAGFTGFYTTLHEKLRSGEPAVWFLVLSPYLLWQTLRLTLFVFRASRAKPADRDRAPGPARKVAPHL